jgi:hypothetical protein
MKNEFVIIFWRKSYFVFFHRVIDVAQYLQATEMLYSLIQYWSMSLCSIAYQVRLNQRSIVAAWLTRSSMHVSFPYLLIQCYAKSNSTTKNVWLVVLDLAIIRIGCPFKYCRQLIFIPKERSKVFKSIHGANI